MVLSETSFSKEGLKEFLKSNRIESIVIASVLLFIVAGATASGVLNAGGSSGDLIAEYRFDEGAGETAYDTSNNSYDGTLEGFSFDSTDGWVSGVDGKALELSDGDYVDIDSFDLTGRDELSVSLWINPDSVSSNTPGHGGAGGEDNELVWFEHGGDAFTLNLGNNDELYGYVDPGSNGGSGSEAGCSVTTSSDVISTDEWQLVTGVYDGDSLHIFHNSEEVGSCSAGTEAFESSNGGQISGHRDDSFSDWFDGTVDSVRVYDEGLNQSQVNSLYNRGGYSTGEQNETSGKLLDIGFRRKNSTHVFDTSGSFNHGEPKNGASQKGAIECKVGRCYSFDGDNDYIDADSVEGLGSGSKEPHSVLIWAYIDSTSGSPNIFHMGTNNNGKLSAFEEGGACSAGNWNWYFYSNDICYPSPPTNEWVHIALVYDGSDYGSPSSKSVYYDGIKQDFVTDNSDSNDPLDLNTDPQLYIAADKARGRYFDGKIDQFQVFEKALSQEEVIEKARKVESSGAVLDLRLNEEGGDIAFDSSLHDNHGTLKPDESSGPNWTRGVSGNALEFDGSDDSVDIPAIVTGDTVTFMAWVYFDDFDSNSKPFSQRDDSTDNTAYEMSYVNSNDVYECQFKSDSGTFVDVEISPPEKKKWVHYTCKYNGTHGIIYENGVKKKSQTVPEIRTPDNGSIGSLADATGSFFDGKIDQVKVYPYDISSSKVKQLYKRGSSRVGERSDKNQPQSPPENNLILYQSLDRIETCGQSNTLSCPSGLSGELAVDESGLANHGELMDHPNVTGATECKVGGCLDFDGNDDEVELDSSVIDSGSPHTVSMWIKIDTLDGNYRRIFNTNDNDNGIRILLSAGNRLRYALEDSGSLQNVASDVNTGVWYHVVGRFDGSTMELLVDGESKGTTSSSGSGSDPYKLTLGARGDDAEYFDGLIDEVRVYDRYLSDNEIWSLYTQGRDGQGRNEMPGPSGWWRMETGSGSKIYDYAEDGDASLGAQNWVNSSRGVALEFPSSAGSDTVIPQSEVLNETFSKAGLTISFWIRPTGDTSSWDSILRWDVEQENGDTNTARVEMVSDSNRSIYTRFTAEQDSCGDASDGGFWARSSDMGVEPDQWNLYTVTYDGSTVRQYIDGELREESAENCDLADLISDVEVTQLPEGQLMKELRFYPYALTQSQVKQVMNSGGVAIG